MLLGLSPTVTTRHSESWFSFFVRQLQRARSLLRPTRRISAMPADPSGEARARHQCFMHCAGIRADQVAIPPGCGAVQRCTGAVTLPGRLDYPRRIAGTGTTEGKSEATVPGRRWHHAGWCAPVRRGSRPARSRIHQPRLGRQPRQRAPGLFRQRREARAAMTYGRTSTGFTSG